MMKRAAALALITWIAAGADISIRRTGDAFEVIGFSAPPTAPVEGWASLFSVYAGNGDVPPMLGAYSIEGGTLTFRPRFAPAPGVPIRAEFLQPNGAPIRQAFSAAAPVNHPSTRVEQVYPTSDVLPANQLKLYLHFSGPMSRGEVWQHIKLTDQSGKALELPFLEIDQELWDRENRRLTVLFDPGKIKRGVLPREQEGAALEPGRRYTLIIDKGWLDANGNPLKAEYRKSFQVAAEDRTPIRPENWRMQIPAGGSRTALVVQLGEPLDFALAQRLIFVTRSGNRVEGEVSLTANESEWRFTPAEAWAPGAYSLEAGAALEDLAGNRVGRPFDVDTFERISRNLTSKTVSLPFRIK